MSQQARPQKMLYISGGPPWDEWAGSGYHRRLCRGLQAMGYLYGGIGTTSKMGWELHGESRTCALYRRIRRKLLGPPVERWNDERKGYVGRLLRRLPPGTPIIYHFLVPKFDPNLKVRRFLFQDLTVFDAARTESYGHKNLSEEHIAASAQRRKEAYEQVEGLMTFSTYGADSITRDFGTPREKITPLGCGPVRVRGGPVTLDRYRAGKILFIGRNWQRKGGPMLLEAFKQVRKQLSHVTLHIAGTKPEEAVGVEGVQAYGLVSDDEVAKLFATSSMFVMPAICETWGIVYSEAAEAGLPIAGFRAWAMPDIIEDGRSGLLTDQRTPEALAEIMIKMLRDPLLMLAMGRHAQRRSREVLDWPHVYDRLLSRVLPEALNGRKPIPLNATLD